MRAVRVWLWICCALVAAMVAVGGVTRLSGSGLAIVEWAPVRGVIPPLTHAAWLDALEAYRASPEGRIVHPGIELERFRALFLTEWAHRLLARIFGIALVVPFVVFVARRRLEPHIRARVGAAIALAGTQALVGWLMVKSGLVDVPHVSPYRLAAHLLLAFAIFALLFSCALDRDVVDAPRRYVVLSRGLLSVIAIAAVSGAAMAGTRAGLLFATFPRMNGAWAPAGIFAPGPRAAFEDPLTVHFDHRLLALVVTCSALALLATAPAALRPRVRDLLLAIALQITLGAVTVAHAVPLGLALAHQLGGLLVFAAAVRVALTRRVRQPPRSSA